MIFDWPSLQPPYLLWIKFIDKFVFSVNWLLLSMVSYQNSLSSLWVLCFIHYIRTIQIIVIILISTHCSVTINYYAFYNLYNRIISNFLNSCYTLSVKSFWTFHVIDHFFPGVRRGLFFLLISGFATGRVFFIESKKITFFCIHAHLKFNTTWKPHRFFSKIFYSFLELNIYFFH